MGCSNSKEEEPVKSNNFVAMALINANRAAQLMVGDSYQMQNPNMLDEESADNLIRQAKNSGQTVSVMNGCLYLDYKFMGFLPASMS